MFLWTPTHQPFTALVNLVNGYTEAIPENEPFMLASCGGGFANWLQQIKTARGFVGDSSVGWMGLISGSYPSEQEQFEAFFTPLEEYLSRQ